MTIPLRLRTVLTLITVLAVLAPVAASADNFLIQLNGQIPGDLDARVEAAGGTLLRVHPEIGYAYASSASPDFAALLAADRTVKAVDRDLVLQWTPEPTEMTGAAAPTPAGPVPDPTTAPLYPCQWNMHNIDAPGAWALGEFGDPDVKVAVLDSGIDPTHSDTVGKIDLGASASFLSPGSSLCNSALGLPDEETYLDFRFHGTFVATQIVSNAAGIAAVAPDSTVVAVKVLNCLGSGSFGDIIAGILYAAGLPDVSVINMSLGVPGGIPKNLAGAGPLLAAMNQTINYAERQGKLVVSASGNEGLDMDHSGNAVFLPAEAGSGIAAYATAWDDALATYSNYGVSGTWVGAPGGDGPDPTPPLPGCAVTPGSQGLVLGACSQFSVFFGCGPNDYLVGAGTSFASPIVAGVAALIDGQAGGALNGHQLATELANSADDLGKPGVDIFYSHGRVNARKA
ncbi:MAG: S8 family serine peptidase, partial [Acidobacteriota bacterium]